MAVTPLESLLQAIQDFVEVPTLELTPFELGEHLIRLRHGIDVLELNFASAAAAFAATDEYETQGSVTPIDWIRHHCKMSGHAAARAVAAGEQAHRFPSSAARPRCRRDRLRAFLAAGVGRPCAVASSRWPPTSALLRPATRLARLTTADRRPG